MIDKMKVTLDLNYFELILLNKGVRSEIVRFVANCDKNNGPLIEELRELRSMTARALELADILLEMERASEVNKQ